MAAGAGLASPFFFFIAFLLLLLVSLSTPIIHSIWLFDIVAAVNLDEGVFGSGSALASVRETVRFGIFGWCSTALSTRVLNFQVNEPATCSKRHLGFTVSPELEQLLSVIDQNTLVSTLQKALSVVLILHPIACAITFIALVLALLAIVRRHTRFWDLLATGIGVLAAVLSTLISIIDIAFCSIAKRKLHNASHGLATVNWGQAPWLVLVATIFTWIACVGACWGVIRGRREPKTRAETTRY